MSSILVRRTRLPPTQTGCLWSVEDAVPLPPDFANDDEDDLKNNDEILNYDPDDWNRNVDEVTGSVSAHHGDGAEATEVVAPEVEQGDSAHHGDGDGAGAEEAKEHARIQRGKKRDIAELDTFNAEIKRAKKAAQQIDAVAMARDAEQTYSAWIWEWRR